MDKNDQQLAKVFIQRQRIRICWIYKKTNGLPYVGWIKRPTYQKMSLDKDYDDPYNEKAVKRLGKIHRKILPPPAYEKSLDKSLTKSTLSLLDG